MTKVLHVISGLGTGGAETMLTRLAAALQQRGFSQQVASVNGRGEKAAEIERSGVPVTALDLTSIVGAPAAVRRLTRIVKSFQPNIIQGWMYHGDLFATLAHRLAGGSARKLFWNIRASNTDAGGYRGLLRINSWLSSTPDIILANSRSGLDFHIAQGYRPRRSAVIANGVDTGKFRPDPVARTQIRAELGIPADAVVAIHVARVDPMKDHATFLAAVAELSGVHAIMAGAGTELFAGTTNVHALGLRRDVERLYAASDIVVSTSVYAEGFSNVLAEGMSAGLVPVTTDIGDARAIVGDTGAILPLRDPIALRRELAAIAALRPPERQARGLAARRRVEDNFTLAKAADAFARLYSER